MFWAPRLSAIMTDVLVLTMINSTLLSLRPSLLLCETAVDRALSVLGISRRLTPDFFRLPLRMMPVF